MRISTSGFKEAVAKLNTMANAAQTNKFQQVLLRAVEPIAQGARSNVNSVSGRTVAAIRAEIGRNPKRPSAFVKVDRKIAFVMWRGRPFPYPFAVARGHGGPHPAPAHDFFTPAVKAGRGAARRIVRDGIEDILRPYITTLSVGGEFS